MPLVNTRRTSAQQRQEKPNSLHGRLGSMIGMFFLSLVFSIAFCNSNYFSYEKIDSTLHAWSNEFGLNSHPSNDYQNLGIIYNLDTLGYSSRDSLPIFGVKLSANANTEEAEPKVLIVGQSHAEEIYGVEIAMEIIKLSTIKKFPAIF